jgi:hypothetical protein
MTLAAARAVLGEHDLYGTPTAAEWNPPGMAIVIADQYPVAGRKVEPESIVQLTTKLVPEWQGVVGVLAVLALGGGMVWWLRPKPVPPPEPVAQTLTQTTTSATVPVVLWTAGVNAAKTSIHVRIDPKIHLELRARPAAGEVTVAREAKVLKSSRGGEQ